MSDSITKRLHIGGLNANISPENLKDRFKSFGTVESVEWPGADALGQPRRFAYLSLETTAGQYRKCLNIMSGSTWRGTQLRIAEAKPTYTTRLERERNPAPEETAERLRKRKRRIMNIAKGQGIGKEAQDMRMVTPENYGTHKFWSMTPDNTLLRPLALRPTHPLPPISSASSSSSKPRRAPTRARRRVIIPSSWHSSHAHLPDDGDLDMPVDRAEWSFEPEEKLELDDDGYTILGRWTKSVDGEEVAELVKGRRPPDELELDEMDDEMAETDAASSTSELFGARHLGQDRDESPLFSHRIERHAPTVDNTSPDIVEEETDRSAEVQSTEDSPGPLTESIAPPLHRIGPSIPGPVVELPDGIRTLMKQEQARDRSMLDSILGATTDAPKLAPGKLWFEDSDSDADDNMIKTTQVLRLRGGAPDESDEEGTESDAESEESDNSETTSTGLVDSDTSEASEATTSDGSDPPLTQPQAEAGPSKPQATLKDIFTAKHTAGRGGSLLAHLGDIEMDDSFDVPIVPARQDQDQPEEMEVYEPAAKAKFIPNPSEPLFFPTFQPHQHVKTRDLFTADRENPEFEGFFAQETDAEMKNIWERDKLGLTREWKKRHREAKKHRRRKGGAAVDDMD